MIRPAHSRHATAVEAARLRILERVGRSGPVAVPDLAQGWPMTRHHVRLLALDLSRDALVAVVRSSRGLPLLAITDAGRAALERAASDEA